MKKRTGWQKEKSVAAELAKLGSVDGTETKQVTKWYSAYNKVTVTRSLKKIRAPIACVAGVQRGGRGESENLCVKCEENAKHDR